MNTMNTSISSTTIMNTMSIATMVADITGNIKTVRAVLAASAKSLEKYCLPSFPYWHC